MVIWHAERKRKVSGSKYKKLRDKRKRELGRNPAHTKVDEKRKVVKVRTQGANEKIKVLRTNVANVLNPKTNKYRKVKILKVLENKANRHFARRSIITKGAIIETEAGKAKVTNRPGQDGTINAVLISNS
ncbi:MAG: 30S ribosomal protein S8e [Nanoarchaeota archaeon]|nr:30S ribosomal protein S8e [Nanoarchaeota archaeon]